MRSNAHLKFIAAVVFLAAACILPAHAAILVTNTSTQTSGNQSSGFTFSSFDLMGGNTAVALVSWEQLGGSLGTVTATYGGVPMTGVWASEPSDDNLAGQHAGVFYAIGVASGLDLVVMPSSRGGPMFVSAVGLSDVGSVFDTDIATGLSGSVGIVTHLFYDAPADGFSIAAYVDNSFDATAPPAIGTSTDHLDTIIAAAQGTSVVDAGFAHAYGSTYFRPNSFEQFIESSGGSVSDREAAALVNFAQVPEPSSLAMMLVGGIGLLTFARRRK